MTGQKVYFNELAELFATFAADTDVIYRPWLDSMVTGGDSAVDLGCGSGRWTGLHPSWLEHALNDVPLTRPEFHRQYGEAFPGAEFTDLHRVVTAMRWTNPD